MAGEQNKLRALSLKQQEFVNNYADKTSETFGNGYKSALKAKYHPHTAKMQACRMLTKDNIKQAISVIRAENGQKTEINREYVVSKCQAIADENGKDRVSALALLSDVCGFKRESAPNSEKEAARRTKMDAHTKKLAERMAKEETSEAADEPQTAQVVKFPIVKYESKTMAS